MFIHVCLVRTRRFVLDRHTCYTCYSEFFRLNDDKVGSFSVARVHMDTCVCVCGCVHIYIHAYMHIRFFIICVRKVYVHTAFFPPLNIDIYRR